MVFFFFFFKQKTAYEMQRGLVGSEMCIRDRVSTQSTWEQKQAIIASEDLDITFRIFYLDFKKFSEKNLKVLSYFRFIEYDGDPEILKKFVNSKVPASKRYRKVRVPALSKENERMALEAFRIYVDKALEGFTVPLEEDLKRLNELSQSVDSSDVRKMNEINILTVRTIEHKIYMTIQAFIKLSLLFLELTKVAAIQEIKKLPETNQIKYYIENTIIPLLK
eukprot:TRINITY_DN3331_c0_g1_i4.p1 TRINITY_DN3331_c0_g1~~TRINITY_DN3331_c0_g1_i4.p1  ORF type:complete len:221 (-),score=64.03 TRINITY_DN3331_c0_g1_i4:124-786(-)